MSRASLIWWSTVASRRCSSTEFARRELALNLGRFKMKNVAPLFCGRRVTLAADHSGTQWNLKAYDDSGRIAAEMEAEVNEL